MTGLRISVVLLAALAAGQYWLGLGLGVAPGGAAGTALGAAFVAAAGLVALPGRWAGAGGALLAAATVAALVPALALADGARLARLDLWPLGLAGLTAGLAILSLAAERGQDPVPLASLPLGAAAVFVALSLLAQPAAPSGALRLATATLVHLALALVAGAILAGLAVAVVQQALAPRGRDFLRALIGLLPLLGFTGTVLGIMSALTALPEVLAGPAADPGGTAMAGLLGGLAAAFETTLIGLVAAALAGFLLALVQAALPEEAA